MNASVATAKELSALEELVNMPQRGENPYIREWKEKGGKVFGFMCTYVPEEILYSENGRILPIRVGAAGCTSTDEADIYLHRFHCTYPRCLLQLGIKGEYDFLDGFVFMNGCEQLRRVYELWDKTVGTDYMGMLSVPHSIEGEGRFEWYVDELKKMTEGIATRFGYFASPSEMQETIKVYNRYRELMGELYKIRIGDKPLLTGAESMGILNASYSMPKKELNTLLEVALAEIKQRPGISDFRARIMVAGSYMDDNFLINLIETSGAIVVTDNLCFGRRSIDGMVDEDGDPFAAIAKRYFYHNPCPRMMGTYKERLEYTKRVAREANVDGIIFERIPFCDNHGAESVMEAKDLEKEGIPTLILEREYIASDEGRLKTRIQAFLEKMGK